MGPRAVNGLGPCMRSPGQGEQLRHAAGGPPAGATCHSARAGRCTPRVWYLRVCRCLVLCFPVNEAAARGSASLRLARRSVTL